MADQLGRDAVADGGLTAVSLDRLPNRARPGARDPWRMVLTRR